MHWRDATYHRELENDFYCCPFSMRMSYFCKFFSVGNWCKQVFHSILIWGNTETFMNSHMGSPTPSSYFGGKCLQMLTFTSAKIASARLIASDYCDKLSNRKQPDIRSECGSLHRLVEIVTSTVECPVHEVIAEVFVAVDAIGLKLKKDHSRRSSLQTLCHQRQIAWVRHLSAVLRPLRINTITTAR